MLFTKMDNIRVELNSQVIVKSFALAITMFELPIIYPGEMSSRKWLLEFRISER